MVHCTFCKREFTNPQAVKAHLRTCEDYQKTKNCIARGNAALGSSSNSAKSIHQDSLAPNEPEKPSNPFVSVVEEITRQFAGPDEATRRKQTREAVLAWLCTTLVDGYHPPEGVVTPEMAVAAKVALLDELALLPIEDLTPTERWIRGEAIRNRIMAPFFRTQREQRDSEKAEAEYQKELRRQELLQMKEEAAVQARRRTRKAALIEIGVARAVKALPTHRLLPGSLALFEWEVRERLALLLMGDESEQQADEAIEAAICGPVLEWEQRLEQTRLAQRHCIMNQCIALAAPLVEATLPWVTDVVAKKFRETFGGPPASQSTSQPNHAGASSATPAPTSSPDVTTPDPVSTQPVPFADHIMDRKESVPPSESETPAPHTLHGAAS